MRLCLVAVIAACHPGPRPPAAAPAADWVAITPDAERLRCASYAREEWRVAVDASGQVTFTEDRQGEPDTGPPLPFTPKPDLEVRGRQHVLAVSDGFLVGYDAGEWGGALYWYAPDGSHATKLADQNVRGLVAVRPDVVAAIEGLAHITMSEGNVRWIERKGGWRATEPRTPLDAAPRAHAATADAIVILTTESLVRVGKQDRHATIIQPTPLPSLRADSMAIGPDGTLWVGARQLVVRMSPAGTTYTPAWLVRPACKRARIRDLSCECSP